MPAITPRRNTRFTALRMRASFQIEARDDDEWFDVSDRFRHTERTHEQGPAPQLVPVGPPPYLDAGAHRCSRPTLRATWPEGFSLPEPSESCHGNRQDLRHHAARRRTVAWDLPRRRREARDRRAARAPRRRRHRGGLPDRVAR